MQSIAGADKTFCTFRGAIPVFAVMPARVTATSEGSSSRVTLTSSALVQGISLLHLSFDKSLFWCKALPSVIGLPNWRNPARQVQRGFQVSAL